jgi:hypothetical protein
MATPEPIAASTRLVSAAVAERRRLARELARVDDRVGGLRHQLAQLDGHAEELRRRIALLDQLADDPDTAPLLEVEDVGTTEAAVAAPVLGYLRGARIRTAAVRLLAASESPCEPIHYSRWYELLRGAGYGISGQDPQATFLTQINRSPVVVRTGEPGTYALDLDAPARLSERLLSLHHELARLHAGQQTLEGFTTMRERRADLSSEYDKIERELAEAIETLSIQPNEGELSPQASAR